MVFKLIAYFLILYLITGIAVSIFYHRILTHKTYSVVPFFEKFLTFLSLPAGTPIQWVGTHLQHHKCTDIEGDPHSPHISGFLFAHCGWYLNSSNRILAILYAFAGPFRMLFDAFWRPIKGNKHNHLAKYHYGKSILSVDKFSLSILLIHVTLFKPTCCSFIFSF